MRLSTQALLAAGLRHSRAPGHLRSAAVLKASRSSFATMMRVEDSNAPLHSGVAPAAGLFWQMTQGSPALRANLGLNDGIRLKFTHIFA